MEDSAHISYKLCILQRCVFKVRSDANGTKYVVMCEFHAKTHSLVNLIEKANIGETRLVIMHCSKWGAVVNLFCAYFLKLFFLMAEGISSSLKYFLVHCENVHVFTHVTPFRPRTLTC